MASGNFIIYTKYCFENKQQNIKTKLSENAAILQGHQNTVLFVHTAIQLRSGIVTV